jgi:serine protease DegQ
MRYLITAGLVGLVLAPAGAADKKEAPPKTLPTYEVPYRLTDTKHVMVRCKINGKGPFNFIIDTGAPALILTEAVAKKVGAKEDKSWVTFDKVELEGGLSIPNPRGIAIDMFQLKGMNAMGLAGVELHGVFGYNVLAQYRIQYDFTDTKLKWTPVDYKVPAPKRFVDKGGSQGGLEFIGTLMQFLSALGGIKPNFEVQPRGFLGAELAADSDQLVVKSVLAGGPADKAGLKSGDRIEAAKGKSVRSPEDLLEAVRKLPEGASLKLSVKRGEDSKDITVELGRGL